MLIAVSIKDLGFQQFTRFSLSDYSERAQFPMHCGEKTSSKNTRYAHHMKWVHKDVVFCLEYQPLGRTGTYVSIGIGLYHQSILLDCRALKPVIKGTKPLR